MTVRTLALVLFSAEEAKWLLPAACDLARARGAHLTGLHPVEMILPYSALGAPYLSATEPVLMDWQEAELRAIRDIFDHAVRGDSFGAEFRAPEPYTTDARTWLLEALRAADLVVMALHPRDGMRPEDRRRQEVVLRESGRPALLLPKGRGLPEPATRLLIGWSPTREATRAAHDALALAAPGAAIDLLQVEGHAGSDRLELDARQDFAAALDRRGFRATLIDRTEPAGDIASVLLRTAAETGAELLATGAFGHSRTYDLVIGAVTRHLLDHAALPLLLSR